MRTTRVFYLLLSVIQFIFFLKLVEYVRGAEIPDTSRFNNEAAIDNAPVSETGDDSARAMFIAPNIKRKKIRTYIGRNTNSSETDRTGQGDGADLNNNQTTPLTQREKFEKEVARLCPGCVDNQCSSVSPISSGFPVVPVIIAVFVGIAWFILFLIAWIFHTRPNTKGQQSGGYGGGYGSHDDDDEKPSIFDHFMKPHERSLKSYTQTLHNVLDSIGKLSDLYNGY